MKLDCLTNEQNDAVERVLGEQGALRNHLVVALSGSHAYGFPSPDSDLDIKGIHAEPTEKFLGLGSPSKAANKLEIVDGVETDYTSNELTQALGGLIGGNGNYLERVLGALILHTTDVHTELKELARGAISKRYHRHYRGFAIQQVKGVREADTPTAKKVLYVLRTALTGTHLLTSGELVVDVTRLLDEAGLGHARELVEVKTRGERTELASGDRKRWLVDLEKVIRKLDEARANSTLPDEAKNTPEIESWLIDYRKKHLGERS